MTLDHAIERLYDLRPGTTPVEEGAPHERPHKPLLLLAALDLIDEGKAAPDRIPCSGASMTVARHPAAGKAEKTSGKRQNNRFSARFLQVRKHNDQSEGFPYKNFKKSRSIAH